MDLAADEVVMRLLARKFIAHAAALCLLSLMATLILLAYPTTAGAQSLAPFVVNGKVAIEGRIPPDGTIIYLRIEGRRDRLPQAKVEGGRFRLSINEPPGIIYQGKPVEFFTSMPNQGEVRFPQTTIWRGGETHNIALELPSIQQPPGGFPGQPVLPPPDPAQPFAPPPAPNQPFQPPVEPKQPSLPIPGLPGIIQDVPQGIDIQCVFKVLGRIPAGPQDMTAQESLKVAQNCLTGNRPPDNTARLELDRKAQEQQQALDKQRSEDQRRLQEERDRLEKERLERERVRQEEQARLEQERFKQEAELLERQRELEEQQSRQNDEREKRRIQQERERLDQQAALDRERLDRERNLEEERIQRERELDVQRARLDQERLQAEQKRLDQEFAQREERLRREQELERRRLEQQNIAGQQQPNQPNGGLNRPPPANEPSETGPSRGFFTNSSVGGLGAANYLLDPSALAIIGILLTLVATMAQMLKGG